MTTHQQPEPDASGQQVNTHGGTGFIGGTHEHHYHSGDYPAGTATHASRQATSQGVVLGDRVTECDPAALGVHASITMHDETSLTPYLARAHDQHLRQVLEYAATSSRTTLVLVVGTSCSGKTRTLYEAVTAVLPDWTLTAPRTDSHLAQALLDGIPAHTVIWLDELQDRLPATTSGITTAKAISELLHAEVGPIVVAGTLWPTNHAAMTARPDPRAARAGDGAIPDLLTQATIITVPATFTDTDLDQASIDDPRLRKAIDVATRTAHPDGRKITQVLAGGTQLQNRLYPAVDLLPVDAFSPAARAVLHAAGDLRRVGMPNPLPRWALEGAAPGYLQPSDNRPPEHWLPIALHEVTEAALHDDPLTATHTHDHHTHGVPALTPHWTTTPDGDPLEAYELHDYLLQDHRTRRRRAPTSPRLWTTLTTHAHPRNVALALSVSAANRGLLTTAIHFLRPHDTVKDALADLLAELGDDASLAELRTIATSDYAAKNRLVRLLADRAEEGDDASLAELDAIASSGHHFAGMMLDEVYARSDEAAGDRKYLRERLDYLLATRGPDAVLNDLHALADDGSYFALDLLMERETAECLEPRRFAEIHAGADAGSEQYQSLLVGALAARGDRAALAELRGCVLAGYPNSGTALLSLLRQRSPDRFVLELDYSADPVHAT